MAINWPCLIFDPPIVHLFEVGLSQLISYAFEIVYRAFEQCSKIKPTVYPVLYSKLCNFCSLEALATDALAHHNNPYSYSSYIVTLVMTCINAFVKS